jgi:hypothetical protein
MDTLVDLSGRRCHFAIKIEPSFLLVSRPSLFKYVRLFGGRDTESTERQDHGADTGVRLSPSADMPTLRTPDNRGANLPLGSNPLQRRVQLDAQFD